VPGIIKGVNKFQKEVYPEKRDLFTRLAQEQNPEVLFITCSDSRVDPNLLTQSEPGELFICRTAGNIVPPYTEHTGGVTATIEYAVAVLGVRHIIVCGHSGCGAMQGILHPESLINLPHACEWLSYSKSACDLTEKKAQGLGEDEQLNLLIHENVLSQLQHLKTHPKVAGVLSQGKITLHGWVYDIKTGKIDAYDKAQESFVPFEECYADVLSGVGESSF